MNISDYKSFYNLIGSRPKKSLGQNFLIDKNILIKIGEFAELEKDDMVIEVGTGFGVLTEYLAISVKEVITIEKDKVVFDHTRQRLQEYENIQFNNSDALDVNYSELLGSGKYNFIANLPYSVASQVIFSLLDYAGSFTKLVIMVQKEMGHRICSGPDSKQYGAFSVIVQSYFDARIMHTVSPNSFWPKPEVDSVLVKMIPHEEKVISDDQRQLFNLVVKKAFQTRRKKMINNLRSLLEIDRLNKIFDTLKIDTGARAEQLSVDQFVQLTIEIEKYN